MIRVIFLVSFCAVLAQSHPTMYRMNDNKVLEPDLVPVSSTVIPLPVYKVSFGINVLSDKEGRPGELETVHTKKKAIPKLKTKHLSDVSSIKQISQTEKEYRN